MVIDGRGVAGVDHVRDPCRPPACVLIDKHLAVSLVGATDDVDVAVTIDIGDVHTQVIHVGCNHVFRPGRAVALVLAPDQKRSPFRTDDDVQVTISIEIGHGHPIGAAAAQRDARPRFEGAVAQLPEPGRAEMNVDEAIAVDVPGSYFLAGTCWADHRQRPVRTRRVVRDGEHRCSRRAVVPRQDDLLVAAGDHLIDAHALKEVSSRRTRGDVEDGEITSAVILSPREVPTRNAPVGSQHVHVAVRVEVVDGRHVVHGRTYGPPHPRAVQRARVRIPPASGHDIRESVTVQILPCNEDRPPRQ